MQREEAFIAVSKAALENKTPVVKRTKEKVLTAEEIAKLYEDQDPDENFQPTNPIYSMGVSLHRHAELSVVKLEARWTQYLYYYNPHKCQHLSEITLGT